MIERETEWVPGSKSAPTPATTNSATPSGCELKEMVLEDVQSDLCALRKLYGLLQKGEDDDLPIARFEVLDEKGRLLLKSLLDGATERVFEAHSKIIAAQLGGYNAPCSTQMEHPKETPKLQYPPISSNVSQTYPSLSMNSTKGPSPQKIASQKYVVKPPIQSASESENRKKRCRACQLSSVKKFNSAEGKKLYNEKKNNPNKDLTSQLLCVSGQLKELELEEKAIEKQRQKRIREIQDDPSRLGSSACASNSPTSDVKSGAKNNFAGKIEQKRPVGDDSISKEVTDAIKQIDLRIALQLAAERVGPLGEKSPAKQGLGRTDLLSQAGDFDLGRTNLLSQRAGRWVQDPKGSSQVHQVLSQTASQLSEMKLPNKIISQALKPIPATNDSLNQLSSRKVQRNKVSQVSGQNVKAIVDKIESLSRVTSEHYHTLNQTHKFVQGFRVSPGQKGIASVAPPLPAKLPSQISKENRDQNQMNQKDVTRNVGKSQQSMPFQSVASNHFVAPDRKSQGANSDSKLSWIQSRNGIQREKGMPRQRILRPTLLDRKPGRTIVSPILYEDRVDKNQSGVQKFDHMSRRRKVLAHQQESEGSSPNLHSSSTWTSEKASMSGSGSESEGSPLSSRTPTQQYTGSTSSSESEMYPRPGRTCGRYVGPTSNSESDVNSLPNKTRAHRAGPTSSSESDSYSAPDRMVSSSSGRLDPTKNYRTDNCAKPERKIGRFRKLKDKLAIIFHHHHHHHLHHHHDHHQQTKAGRATSLWKYAGKAFHRSGKDGAYGERAVEKLGKSVVRSVPDKNQHRHFHALVEGLLRHVRHSKKSKPPKGGIGRSGNHQHGGKKMVKKLHWWQMFQRHKGVKLPSKPPRVRLGLGSKKPQLRVIPKVRKN